jgi:hypothetical protein
MSGAVYANIELVPIDVPSRVKINVPIVRGGDDDYKQFPTVALEDLSPSELEGIAQLWLDNLFASVGRANPFKIPEKVGKQ